jgi:hypothetical protein
MYVQDQIVHVDWGHWYRPLVNMILDRQRRIGNKISINYMLMSTHYNEMLIDSLLSPTGMHIFNLINSLFK